MKNAGSIFPGRYAPRRWAITSRAEPHAAHAGTARFASPLSVDDFVKKSSYIYYSREAFAAVKDDVARFARAEGLEAHARSALSRFEEENA